MNKNYGWALIASILLLVSFSTTTFAASKKSVACKQGFIATPELQTSPPKHQKITGKESSQVYAESEIATVYPDAVLAQSKHLLRQGLTSKHLSGRTNFTAPWMTIDGKETIDRDDAIFVEQLRNGNYRLHVAVPDLTAFFKPGSPITEWIHLQTTSHYLRDQVFHMLPPELVSGLLSLDPGKKRLAFVYSTEYSLKEGRFINFKAERAVVTSRKAVTYEEFQEKMENQDLQHKHEKHAIDLYNILGKTRTPNIQFPFQTEKKALLNEHAQLSGFEPLKDLTANHFIEVFMVTINSMGAKYMNDNNIPGMFRIQDAPDLAKIKAFFAVIDRLGFRTEYQENMSGVENLQIAFNKLKNYEHPKVLMPLLFNVTMKAENSIYMGTHSFLRVSSYSFLTSPLRRLADFWNQGMIAAKIEGRLEVPKVLRLVREQENILARDNDNMDLAKKSEVQWQSIMELKLSSLQEGFGYQGIIARGFADFDLVFIPEKDIYVEVEREARKTEGSFAQTGKRVFLQVVSIDYEAGIAFGEYR